MSNKKIDSELKFAKVLWSNISEYALAALRTLIHEHGISIRQGDVACVDNRWYVTHSGLLRLARRKRCAGINVRLLGELCNPVSSQWVFVATVYKTRYSRGFAGYGDADPSNVSPLVHGAEMRVAETRAVNRALRKAYGIGICSVEEIGSLQSTRASEPPVRKLPPESSNNGHGRNGSGNGTRVRLCQLIRQPKLDAELVEVHSRRLLRNEDIAWSSSIPQSMARVPWLPLRFILQNGSRKSAHSAKFTLTTSHLVALFRKKSFLASAFMPNANNWRRGSLPHAFGQQGSPVIFLFHPEHKHPQFNCSSVQFHRLRMAVNVGIKPIPIRRCVWRKA
jgi:hypothetical protein